MIFPRTVARYAAVQVVFQKFFFMDRASIGLLQEFERAFIKDHTYDIFDEGEPEKIDRNFFSKLAQGTLESLPELEMRLSTFLPRGWVLDKMEKCTWALLCCAAYEIQEDLAPMPVVINEYVSLAHAFLPDRGASFINGLLQSFSNAVSKDKKAKAQEPAPKQTPVEAMTLKGETEQGQKPNPQESLEKEPEVPLEGVALEETPEQEKAREPIHNQDVLKIDGEKAPESSPLNIKEPLQGPLPQDRGDREQKCSLESLEDKI